jgi:hypothetical protein
MGKLASRPPVGPPSGTLVKFGLAKKRISMSKSRSGPTGGFPRGRLSAADEGELQIAIRSDAATRTVVIDFGKDVSWLGMNTATARALAEKLLATCDTIDNNQSENPGERQKRH